MLLCLRPCAYVVGGTEGYVRHPAAAAPLKTSGNPPSQGSSKSGMVGCREVRHGFGEYKSHSLQAHGVTCDTPPCGPLFNDFHATAVAQALPAVGMGARRLGQAGLLD